MSDLHKAISDGLANARFDPNEWGEPLFLKPEDHPNHDTQLVGMKTFTVIRKVMDKRQGDNGLIKLNVRAANAAEAGRLADKQVEGINAREYYKAFVEPGKKKRKERR